MTGKRAIQPWLLDELVKRGVIDGKGINDRPKERTCRCKTRIIAAWADGTGEAVYVDPVALTPLGELQALAEGRRTFDHWTDGLDTRRPEWITRWPAGSDDTAHPIRPEHRCGQPPPDHTTTTRVRDADLEHPPF